MTKIYQDTSYEPKIILQQVDGNLRIKGWDRPEVRFDADNPDDLEITQDGTTFTVICRSNLYLRLPTTASIDIKQVHGNGNFKSVEGDIHLAKLQGNATFKLVGSIEVESLQGNLTASRIEGSLKAHNIEGNANVRDVEDILSIQGLAGHLTFRGAAAEIDCKAGGNASLLLETEPGGCYKVEANGNISCTVDAPGDANIVLFSQTKKIHIETAEGSEVINAERHEIKVGESDVDIHLQAGTGVDLKLATIISENNMVLSTSEERMKVLQMVQEDNISAEDGAKLLTALSGSQVKSADMSPSEGRYMRVSVTDSLTGKTKVSVNLPLGLVDAGLNIASNYVNNIGVEDVKEAIKSGVTGKIVDVHDEEDGEHVEIFIE